jgi:hypothetical protein
LWKNKDKSLGGPAMKNLFTHKAAKAVFVLAAACLLLALAATAGADDPVMAKIKKFPDVPEGHWAYIYVVRLTNEGAITGYPDGSFGPLRNITRAEFLAVAVGALLGRPEAPPAGQHWAVNIMQAAEKNNLLETGEFAADTWGQPINRQEMAKIMARAMQYVRKETQVDKTSLYTSKITDYNSIPESYRPYVAQTYAKGIVTGYPDGSFGGSKQATRAEAATMVVRLIDPIYRLGGDDIAFDPKTDVAADGRMKLAKAEEYMMKTLQSLKFYQEGGKFYFEGNVAEVPEGFRNNLSISIGFKEKLGLPVATYGSHPLRAQTALPKVGPFKEELKGISSRNQIEGATIILYIDAPKHTNTTYDQYGYEVLWLLDSSYDNRIDVYDYITYRKTSSKFYDFSTIFLWGR